VSCTFNEVTYQLKENFCMKWGGERRKSFHHGEMTQHRFPGLGNAVKRPLRGKIVSFSIPCAEQLMASTSSRCCAHGLLLHVYSGALLCHSIRVSAVSPAYMCEVGLTSDPPWTLGFVLYRQGNNLPVVAFTSSGVSHLLQQEPAII
jgi:hypothetical protein